MGDGHIDCIVRGQRAQRAVLELRFQKRGQVQGVEHRSRWAQALLRQESQIETYVLTNDGGLADELFNVQAQRIEVQRVRDVGVADAGHLLHAQWDRDIGIDERVERLRRSRGARLGSVSQPEAHHPDLGDAVLARIQPRRFEVDRDKRVEQIEVPS